MTTEQIYEPYADLALVRGIVYTMADDGARASAVAVRGNTIVAVGDDASIEPWIGPRTRVVDMAGRYLLPGLIDTHVHLATDARGGDDRIECRDFYVEIESISDITDRMIAAVRENPRLEEVAVIASPMQELRLTEKRRPTRDELDAAVPDRPAYVAFGAHIAVANSKAMEKAGVTAATADPKGGFIERDEKGEPTGVFRETARYLFMSAEAASTFDEYKELVRNRLLDAAKRGTTMIHDIVKSRVEIQVYEALEREGRLPIRVQLIVRVVEAQFDPMSLFDLGFQPMFGSDMLQLGGIKMSIDGGFTARQGMFHPLSCEPEENHPLLRIPQQELDCVVKKYHEAGMRICVHAIGDHALDMILDSYEAALEAMPRDNHRHRIEHMANFIATDEQILRARELGVVPMPNPSMLYYLASEATETLTEERMRNPLPIRQLLDDGFSIASGSDAPGYWPIDPLRDAGFCVTRRTVDGKTIAPEQAITPLEALGTITRNAAWMGFMEGKIGTIESGKLADLTLLADDPLNPEGVPMAEVRVELTICDGVVIFEADTASGQASAESHEFGT